MSTTSSLAGSPIRKTTLPALLLGLAIFVYASGFSYLTLTRYAAFEARALDLGNLHQTVWNTAHGRPFHMTNQPGTVNRLSLHVEPILLPIATLYWIHDGPETLLILQSIVVALGALPLYALAQYRLQNRWLALTLGAVYLLNPTIQAANWLEFHPVTLAPTFLMAAFYFLVTKRNGWFVLFAILAASCKEEIGLLLFMMGLYTIIVLRRPQVGSWTMLFALSWSLVAVLGIQHYFAAGNIHWGRYDYLGESPLAKAAALFTQPMLIWQQLQAAEAGGYLLRLLWPVAFVALLAPEILLLALPSLAINLLADFPPMHQVYELIYAAPILPFVMVATVEGIGKVVRLYDSPTQTGVRHLLPQSYGSKWYLQMRGFRRILIPKLLVLLTVIAALIAQYRHGYLPGGGNYQLYTVSDHDRQAAAIIAQIPTDAKVSAQDKLDPHVAGRETIYIFPRVEDADTIFVDVTGPAWPQHPNDLYRDLQTYLNGDFGVAAGSDGYLLLRKDATSDQLPDAFFNAFRRSPTATKNPTGTAIPNSSTFGEQLTLIDHIVTVDEHGETVVQLYWKLYDQPVAENYRIYVAFADRTGNVLHDTLFYPSVATLWYPTSLWKQDEIVLIETLPWSPTAEQFTLYVGVYQGEDGWSTGQRLPLRGESTAIRLQTENKTVVRVGSYQRSADRYPAVPLRQTLNAAAQRVNVQFGNEPPLFWLSAVDLGPLPTAAGQSLDFALEWLADNGLTVAGFDYAIFAHLLNDAGEKVAQLDWQPHDDWGPRPMTTWIEAASIVDRQRITLPSDLPAGNYHLVIGVYNWQTGERLATQGESARSDDVVEIAQFSIK